MEITARFPARHYDLAATLTSGQAFRWTLRNDAWEAVIQGRWVRLRQFTSAPLAETGVASLEVGRSMLNAGCSPDSTIEATVAAPQPDWHWLTRYLRLHDDFDAHLATFPDDEPMRAALAHCRGLRLLRQEPWECLASFILSSTKQIVQIQQCVTRLCERFGEPVDYPAAPHPACGHPLPVGRGGEPAHFTFPTAARLAAASEAELRQCKIGFRARYLLAAARLVAVGGVDLAQLPALPLAAAREQLMRCPGVGPKIADCALLFSLGFDAAFPIDVWVERALRQLYFPKRRVRRTRIERFAATHFGPHAGLAQQYLFHYLRTRDARGRRGNGTETRLERASSASSRRRLQPKKSS